MATGGGAVGTANGVETGGGGMLKATGEGGEAAAPSPAPLPPPIPSPPVPPPIPAPP